MPNQVLKYLLKLYDRRRVSEELSPLESSCIQEWIWNSTKQEINYYSLLQNKLRTY
jgi:hypothetical protein